MPTESELTSEQNIENSNDEIILLNHDHENDCCSNNNDEKKDLNVDVTEKSNNVCFQANKSVKKSSVDKRNKRSLNYNRVIPVNTHYLYQQQQQQQQPQFHQFYFQQINQLQHQQQNKLHSYYLSNYYNQPKQRMNTTNYKIYNFKEVTRMPSASPSVSQQSDLDQNDYLVNNNNNNSNSNSNINNTNNSGSYYNKKDRSCSTSTSKTNLYIRGLDENTTDNDLFEMCKQFGDIKSTKAIIDKQTTKCKGYGFVDFKNPNDAVKALNELKKEQKDVQLAKQREQDPTNLYFANLPSDIDETCLSELLTVKFKANVSSTRIMRERNNNSKGVGFARIDDNKLCDQIIAELNGKPFPDHSNKNKILLVKLADTGGNIKNSNSSKHFNRSMNNNSCSDDINNTSSINNSLSSNDLNNNNYSMSNLNHHNHHHPHHHQYHQQHHPQQMLPHQAAMVPHPMHPQPHHHQPHHHQQAHLQQHRGTYIEQYINYNGYPLQMPDNQNMMPQGTHPHHPHQGPHQPAMMHQNVHHMPPSHGHIPPQPVGQQQAPGVPQGQFINSTTIMTRPGNMTAPYMHHHQPPGAGSQMMPNPGQIAVYPTGIIHNPYYAPQATATAPGTSPVQQVSLTQQMPVTLTPQQQQQQQHSMPYIYIPQHQTSMPSTNYQLAAHSYTQQQQQQVISSTPTLNNNDQTSQQSLSSSSASNNSASSSSSSSVSSSSLVSGATSTTSANGVNSQTNLGQQFANMSLINNTPPPQQQAPQTVHHHYPYQYNQQQQQQQQQPMHTIQPQQQTSQQNEYH